MGTSPAMVELTSHLTNWFDILFSEFDARFSQTTSGVRFNSANKIIECRSKDVATLELIAEGHDRATDAEGLDVRILHVCKSLMPEIEYPKWPLAYFNEREVEKHLQRSRYRLHFFSELNYWQIFDRETNRGLQFAVSHDGLPLWENGSPLRNFINWATIESGGGLVHAGTLGTDVGGVLIAGKGGSGKSGTVIGGLVNQLNSVGDDYVSTFCNGSVTAHRAFSTLKIDPSGAARVGLAQQALAGKTLNWQNKFLLRLEDANPNIKKAPLPIVAILVPRITHAASTTFSPISSKEAFIALAPSGVTQMHSARTEMIAHCAKIVRLLPAFEMQLGTNAAEISSAIADFIEGQKR